MTPPPAISAEGGSKSKHWPFGPKAGGGVTPPPAISAEGGSKKAFVYLLRSLKDGKFYLGWTTNLENRLNQHNMGLCRSTKTRNPFELIHYETFDTIEAAKKREHQLKRNSNTYYLFKKGALLSTGPSGQRQVVG